MSQQYYSGAIWTKHVLDRIRERGFTQDQAAETFRFPDTKTPGKETGTIRFEKRFGNSRITTVAKLTTQNEWVVLSAWIDPPLPGTKDERKKNTYRKYQKASAWGKIWMTILRQFGLINY